MPFNVGPVELVLVLVIALLVIGPKRLPEMGNSLGKSIREFRNASSEMGAAPLVDREAGSTSQSGAISTQATTATPADATPADPAEAASPAEPKSDA